MNHFVSFLLLISRSDFFIPLMSQTLGMEFSIPVPELIKVIPALLWWDAIPLIDKLLLLPRGHLQDETKVQKLQIY